MSSLRRGDPRGGWRFTGDPGGGLAQAGVTESQTRPFFFFFCTTGSTFAVESSTVEVSTTPWRACPAGTAGMLVRRNSRVSGTSGRAQEDS